MNTESAFYYYYFSILIETGIKINLFGNTVVFGQFVVVAVL